MTSGVGVGEKRAWEKSAHCPEPPWPQDNGRVQDRIRVAGDALDF